MFILDSLGEIDTMDGTNPGECLVDSIEEVVDRDIIFGLDSLTLEHSSKSFGSVEMRRIRRQEEKVKSPSLPYPSHFPHMPTSMHLCIVKYDEYVLPYCKENLSRKLAIRSLE